MKKTLSLVLVLVVLFTLTTAACAATSLENDDSYAYVGRPKIILRSSPNGSKVGYLTFGTPLKVERIEGSWAKVAGGYVDIGYLVKAKGSAEFTDKNGGVAPSPYPGMQDTDFGYAAGGRRMNEKALIIDVVDFSTGERWAAITTNEGMFGWINLQDPDVSNVRFW